MTKLDEIARAIMQAQLNKGPATPRPYNPSDLTTQEIARIAVEAMREPNEAMVKAVDDADLDIYFGYEASGDPGGPEDVYRAMIDAILNEKPG